MTYRLVSALCLAFVLAACGGLETGPPIAPGEDGPPPPDASEDVVEEETDAGRAAAELTAEPSETDADGEVVIRVVNHGDIELAYGRPITVERWDGEEWVETDESRESAWTMELLLLPAGETGVDQPWPFMEGDSPEPGWYRFTKRVHDDHGTELIVRARVEVTG